MEWRIIRENEVMRSFLSNPRLREGHCLVIPNRHVTEFTQLEPKELQILTQEIGRLARILNEIYGEGYQIINKYRPNQAGKGITVAHMHTHIVPMLESDGLFAMPDPNAVDGFKELLLDEAKIMLEVLR